MNNIVLFMVTFYNESIASMTQVYSLLIQEEKQREIYSDSQFSIILAAMAVGNSYNAQQRVISQRGKQDTRNQDMLEISVSSYMDILQVIRM